MSGLTREVLLAAAASNNLPKEKVECPELGGYVWVRGMTGAERDDLERSNYVKRRGRIEVDLDRFANIRARLLVRCVVDDNGQRLFANEDAPLLGGLRADTISKLHDAAQRLSQFSDEDIDELKKSAESLAGTASSSS